MIKLSKAGWNNVIIFAVLAFILLINATNKNVFSAHQSPSVPPTIFAESSVILTLTINQQIVINRNGTTWQAIPAVIQGQLLEQMMMAWQRLEGQPISAPDSIDQQFALIITVDIAGQNEATVLHLYATELALLIHNQQTDQWYSLAMQLYQQLLPANVLMSN